MFEKKYVFETERTKFLRWLLNVGIVLSIFISFIIFIGIYIPFFSQSESEATEQAFFKKDPQLIAVFTGDSGRISYAIELAKKYKTSKILISGVHEANTIQTLVNQQIKGIDPDLVKQLIEANRLELDHVAKNTIENVFSTFHYIRNANLSGDILIVSNDYHIMRIKLIVEMIRNEKDNLVFHYKGQKTDYTNLRNIKILYKEVTKYIKAYFFLLLWDSESIRDFNIDLN